MVVDLFLGGPLGLWVLDQVQARDVGVVFSDSATIVHKSRQLGLAFEHYPLEGPQVQGANVGLSMHFPHLFPPEVLGRYDVIYNIHPGYLPWGRCYYPVFWALWNLEPAGCTLHVIDNGIDTGPIVAQRSVPHYAWDTGGSLHQRVSDAEKGLFLQYWPDIVSGEPLYATPQEGKGSFHSRKDFMRLKQTAAWQNMSRPDLLRLIQCLSHPDYSGLEVEFGNRKYEISMRPL